MKYLNFKNKTCLKLISLSFVLIGLISFTIFSCKTSLNNKEMILLDNKPFKISLRCPSVFSGNSLEAKLVNSILKQSQSVPLSGAVLCHLLKLYGLGSIDSSMFSSGMDVLNILTDDSLAKEHLGTSIIFETRYGIRYKSPVSHIPKQEDGENHRDIFLATFAELGLPLATPINTSTGSFTIENLLMDSIMNFDLQQEEIAWTAVAYILYIPRQQKWTNRFGETFTLNDLATELLKRPIHKTSCGGTHLFYSLTILSQVDSKLGCLTDDIRNKVFHRLQNWKSSVVRSQTKDGYWNLKWALQDDDISSNTDTHFDKFLMTGHILECMQRLPSSLQPDTEVYLRAANWLYSELSEMQEPIYSRLFCPWTHAVCSIRNLVYLPEESSADKDSLCRKVNMDLDQSNLVIKRATVLVAPSNY